MGVTPLTPQGLFPPSNFYCPIFFRFPPLVRADYELLCLYQNKCRIISFLGSYFLLSSRIIE